MNTPTSKYIDVIRVNDIPKRLFSNNFLTDDYKFLCLSYNDTGGSEESKYNNLLDNLDEKYGIYNTVERLYLETDFIYKLPSSIKKFNKLIEIEVQGSRWWNLSMLDLPLPNNIEIVKFVNQSNLNKDCVKGCDQFAKLKVLCLDSDQFINTNHISKYGNIKEEREDENDDESEVILPDLSNLETIELWLGTYYNEENDFDINWKEILKDNCILLKNIKYKINSIEYNTESDWKIIIKLNK